MSWAKLAVGIAVCFCAAGCTVNSPTQGKGSLLQTPEQKVMLRAQARRDALLSGNLNLAYEFISPGGRLLMPVAEYRLRVNAQYARGARVKAASCEGELCEVKIDFDYSLNGIALSQVVTEKWILDGGEWWLVYQG